MVIIIDRSWNREQSCNRIVFIAARGTPDPSFTEGRLALSR
jgi:hypothetical protein